MCFVCQKPNASPVYAFHYHTQSAREGLQRSCWHLKPRGCADICLVARKVLSGEVGRQHPAGSGAKDTELSQPCGGSKACMSSPADVGDDSDDDLPAGFCGHQRAACVCAMLVLFDCELKGCALRAL